MHNVKCILYRYFPENCEMGSYYMQDYHIFGYIWSFHKHKYQIENNVLFSEEIAMSKCPNF